MKNIVIVGYGRFGELLASLYKTSFNVTIVEENEAVAIKAKDAGHPVVPIENITAADYIFLAVPISRLENLLVRIAQLVNSNQVVVDICSVKVYPAMLMQKYLPNAQLLATHPMFGPDSAKKGLAGSQVAFCPINVSEDNLKILRKAWEDLGTVVVDTTPEKHDQETAYSLAFTHTNARVIIGMDIPNIVLKTRSFRDITEIASLAVRDTDQLFHDMLYYNPYFPEMKKRLEGSMANIADFLDKVEKEQQQSNLFRS